jgi:hypothetical protein
LIFALNRVSPPTSGCQQRHLAFISEYTNQLVYCMYQVRQMYVTASRFRISEPVEQHSFIGFHLHCRSVSHTADQCSSPAAMVFTCTAGRFCNARPVEQHSCIGFLSPALHVGGPSSADLEQHSCNGFHLHCRAVSHTADQWSSQAAMVFTCTACQFRTAGPVEQHSCIGFHLHCM